MPRDAMLSSGVSLSTQLFADDRTGSGPGRVRRVFRPNSK